MSSQLILISRHDEYKRFTYKTISNVLFREIQPVILT